MSRSAAVSALRDFTAFGRSLIQLPGDGGDLHGSLRGFVSAGGPDAMLALIDAGVTLYNSLCVKTRAEAEDLWKKYYQ
ncbi:hypothetical protein GN956_G26737 [Arapaima gigas]